MHRIDQVHMMLRRRRLVQMSITMVVIQADLPDFPSSCEVVSEVPLSMTYIASLSLIRKYRHGQRYKSYALQVCFKTYINKKLSESINMKT